MKAKIGWICQVINGRLRQGNMDAEVSGICTDTRKLQPGELFIALKGENFDGHEFIDSAFEKGASGVIVTKYGNRENVAFKERAIVEVSDTLAALQKIAEHYRRGFQLPVVAVTGSTGKTTTKDMIAAVLAQKFAVLKTQGNFNNEIGLPLTLLQLQPHHEVAVVEMGMRGLGEIQRLAEIAQPTIGVVTNVGLTHIELLGSQEAIARAKEELVQSLNEEGIAILNGDDPLVHAMGIRFKGKTVYFGLKGNVDVRGTVLRPMGNEGTEFSVAGSVFFVPLPGRHNVMNALAAIAVGRILGMSDQEINEGLNSFRPSTMRMEITTTPTNIMVINDAYNANPTSMRAALQVLKDLEPGRRKVAILGTMGELGDWGKAAHYEIGEFVHTCGIDLLITVGNLAAFIAEAAVAKGMASDHAVVCQSNQEVCTKARELVKPGDLVLVKGSRMMKMETIVAELKQF